MHIEIIRPPEPLVPGRFEVWLKVSGDEVTDLDRVKAELPDRWQRVLGPKKLPARYFPDKPGDCPHEQAKGRFVDWWVFSLDQWEIEKLEEVA